MIRRKGRGNTLRRLLWLAAACLVLVGLAPSLQGDPPGTSGSLVLSSLKPNPEADHHHSAVRHGVTGNCLSGPGCTSAAVLPEAAVLLIGELAPTLITAGLSPHRWDTLPPLHPPNSSNFG
jgi:hypothetical protein